MAWDKIKQYIKDKKWVASNAGAYAEIRNGADVVLQKHDAALDPGCAHATLSRLGDVFVGFYMRDDSEAPEARLALTIGGQHLSDLTIRPGEFVYLYENKYPCPLISLQYSEVHMTPTPAEAIKDICMVYALLETTLRRNLAMQTNIIGDNIIHMEGRYAKVQDTKSYQGIVIPDMRQGL